MASTRWMYDNNCDDADLLLKEVLEPSPVQEKPIVPAVAQLLEKHSGSEEMVPDLYLSPSQESTPAQSAVHDDYLSIDDGGVSEHDSCNAVDGSLEGMRSLHLRRKSSDEESSFGPERAGSSESKRNDTEEVAEDILERTMGQPFFTQPKDDSPSTFERLMEEDGGAQNFLSDESTSDSSVESILDADGYIKQPSRRVYSYKPGRSSVMIGNTGARARRSQEKTSSLLPRKRTADVDIASLLGEIPDPQSIEWTRSMESSPSQSTPRSMELFDDSDD